MKNTIVSTKNLKLVFQEIYQKGTGTDAIYGLLFMFFGSAGFLQLFSGAWFCTNLLQYLLLFNEFFICYLVFTSASLLIPSSLSVIGNSYTSKDFEKYGKL